LTGASSTVIVDGDRRKVRMTVKARVRVRNESERGE
jgi:hypothetical protein